jgi:hypothetical protein
MLPLLDSWPEGGRGKRIRREREGDWVKNKMEIRNITFFAIFCQ